MFYKQLAPFLDRSPFVNNLKNTLGLSTPLHVYNLNRSAKSVLVAHAFKTSGRNVVFVVADDRLAEDYLDDLQILLGEDQAFFLPDFEVLPYEDRSPHYTIRAQRINTLARVVSKRPAVYVLGVRSLLRRIVPPGLFAKNVLAPAVGQEHNLDEMIEKLVALGFEPQPQVSKVGEFARRGGILDIYSPQYDYPVRIEFFGDEVESIRPFHLASQRSTGEQLESFSILPSREFSLKDSTAIEKFKIKVAQGFYEGIENEVSRILPQTACFADYFEPDTLMVWDEYQNFVPWCNELYQETTELYQKALKERRTVPNPDEIFAQEQEIKKWPTKYKALYLTGGYQQLVPTTIEAPITPQTVMHSDLGLLEITMTSKLDEGYTIFVQSDNRSQSKRMRELLPELSAKLNFSLGVFQKGFNLTDAGLAVFTDHEIFSRYKRRKYSAKFSQEEALVDYETLAPGDYVVHINHGVGVFEGLTKISVGGSEVECLTLRYGGGDKVYVPTHHLKLVSRFVSQEGFAPTLHKLGGKQWDAQKSKARKQIELVAQDLVQLYAQRRLQQGIAFAPDNQWQRELEDSFIYEDTADQARATKEIKQDMEAPVPMERLLCGDVGFGKTEVAIRAAFKAAVSGMQVAVLVPTTLLAEQHYNVFRERMAQYPVRVAMFSRFRTPAQIKNNLKRLTTGEVDIAIGTHRLLSADVKFKKLGLLIIDEEHRFGVRHKNKLRQLKADVDTLYMSATPIPRTMSMALSKLKEMSLIQTSPKARLPIRTVVIPWDEEVIKDSIMREIDRGGQVFFIHNRVQSINAVCDDLRRLLPSSVRIKVGHGQMPERQLEQVMAEFSNHAFDVLVATTIIENGIDIPNANTMIVNQANMFGLAQLYQMRGRVGRSNRRAYAYLIIPPRLEDIARKRLETLTEYNALGAGYQIAMRDLELRGAGTILGEKQSGVINTIGFNYYSRLLNEAVEQLQAGKSLENWQEEQPREITLTCDFYLPNTYVTDDKIRLQLYKRMLEFETSQEFDEFRAELADRFGPLPEVADSAISYFQMNLLAEKVGLQSFKLRHGQVALSFDLKTLPGRDKIGALVSRFTYKVGFDTSKGLEIKFELPQEKGLSKTAQALADVKRALEILEFVATTVLTQE